MPEPRTLGEQIRYLRMRKGLKQSELAAALGVRKSAVCQWEKGQTEPCPERLRSLIRLLCPPAEAGATGSYGL